jgi:hypothetical protein
MEYGNNKTKDKTKGERNERRRERELGGGKTASQTDGNRIDQKTE